MTRPYRPPTSASDLTTWTHHELRAEIERLRNNADLVLHEATRLLEIFVAEHFPHNPDWKPEPDLLGVILQWDNACTIARDYKSEIERLRGGLRMLATQEYDAGYSPEDFADAVLSGHEPQTPRRDGEQEPRHD